jgi:hypothetical protein
MCCDQHRHALPVACTRTVLRVTGGDPRTQMTVKEKSSAVQTDRQILILRKQMYDCLGILPRN